MPRSRNDDGTGSTVSGSSAPSSRSRGSSRRSGNATKSALKQVSITERELRILSRAAAAQFQVSAFDRFIVKTRLGPFFLLILATIFFGIGAAALYLSYVYVSLPLWLSDPSSACHVHFLVHCVSLFVYRTPTA